MKEWFHVIIEKFRDVNWSEGVYEDFKGPIIGADLAASVSGGFGKMLLQGIGRPTYTLWFNDYAIDRSFTARTMADYRSLEFRINLSKGVEHKSWSGKWKPIRANDMNLSHSLVMDSEVRISDPGHYHSLDIHYKPEMFMRFMDMMPELIEPFLNEYHAGRMYSVFLEDIPPSQEMMQLVNSILQYLHYEDRFPLLDSCVELLLGQIFLWKASLSQRRGITKSQMEAYKTLEEVRRLIASEMYFNGLLYYARRANMSLTKFKTLFNTVVGESPAKYFQGIKLQRGLLQLLNTDESIFDIAIDLNYNDSSAFIKAFIDKFGMSPTNYRRFMKGI